MDLTPFSLSPFLNFFALPPESPWSEIIPFKIMLEVFIHLILEKFNLSLNLSQDSLGTTGFVGHEKLLELPLSKIVVGAIGEDTSWVFGFGARPRLSLI